MKRSYEILIAILSRFFDRAVEFILEARLAPVPISFGELEFLVFSSKSSSIIRFVIPHFCSKTIQIRTRIVELKGGIENFRRRLEPLFEEDTETSDSDSDDGKADGSSSDQVGFSLLTPPRSVRSALVLSHR